jgi:outer membrane receptor protein involved in Fe transport
MNTYEVGYKGLPGKKLFIDISYFYSTYTDFIGTQRFFGREDGTTPEFSEVVTPPAPGSPAYRNRTRAMQVWKNATRKVFTQGFQAALELSIVKYFNISTNYTWSKLNGLDNKAPISASSGLILGFNTPEHKFNFGVNGQVVKNLFYNVNMRTISSYNYFMAFDEGLIDGFTSFDAQITYKVPKIHTSFRIGGTNLADANAIQAYGSAPIGRIVYVGALFDHNVFKKSY